MRTLFCQQLLNSQFQPQIDSRSMAMANRLALHLGNLALLTRPGDTVTWPTWPCLISSISFCSPVWALAVHISLLTFQLKAAVKAIYGSNYTPTFVVYQIVFKINCWRALVRQQPILYNSEKKPKFVRCKIGDMRSQLCFLYLGILISGVLVNARGNMDRFRAIAVYSCPTLLEIKDTVNECL